MRRDEVIRRLRGGERELRRLGLSSLYVFGSTARDEARASSDVDLYFDFDNPRFSLIELAQVEQRLSELLGVRADVASRGGLHPRLREGIEKTSLQVF